MESWLRGLGCVPIYNLMEDAATAEISRAQIWQWIHHKAALNDGTKITPELYTKFKQEELKNIASLAGDKLKQAEQLLDKIILAPTFIEFLTLPAYEMIS